MTRVSRPLATTIRSRSHRWACPAQATKLTSAVHWLYDVAWGRLYGLAEGTAEVHPLRAGSAFGSLVFANAYIDLPTMDYTSR